MSDLDLLVSMSKYSGERFDLIQAGGGNSSVKLENGNMAIKASGYLLSDLSIDRGYSIVNNNEVCTILSHDQLIYASSKKEREEISAKLLKDTILTPEARPSIETFLHALLSKYTLHTHPVSVNAITCLDNWKEILIELFGSKILLVNYETPGVELALRLKEQFDLFVQTFNSKPNIVFLQNHGLIVSSDNYDDIQKLTDDITLRLEQVLNINLTRYRTTNHISRLINEFSTTPLITYLSEDIQINELLHKNEILLDYTPYFPDGLVFLGYKPVIIDNGPSVSVIKEYFETYQDHPKLVYYNQNIYFVASNIRKAKEMEDVCKLHLMGLQYSLGKVQQLPLNELKYLGNWEAEKFRQKI